MPSSEEVERNTAGWNFYSDVKYGFSIEYPDTPIFDVTYRNGPVYSDDIIAHIALGQSVVMINSVSNSSMSYLEFEKWILETPTQRCSSKGKVYLRDIDAERFSCSRGFFDSGGSEKWTYFILENNDFYYAVSYNLDRGLPSYSSEKVTEETALNIIATMRFFQPDFSADIKSYAPECVLKRSNEYAITYTCV